MSPITLTNSMIYKNEKPTKLTYLNNSDSQKMIIFLQKRRSNFSFMLKKIFQGLLSRKLHVSNGKKMFYFKDDKYNFKIMFSVFLETEQILSKFHLN